MQSYEGTCISLNQICVLPNFDVYFPKHTRSWHDHLLNMSFTAFLFFLYFFAVWDANSFVLIEFEHCTSQNYFHALPWNPFFSLSKLVCVLC
jgi:hypothetical protein